MCPGWQTPYPREGAWGKGVRSAGRVICGVIVERGRSENGSPDLISTTVRRAGVAGLPRSVWPPGVPCNNRGFLLHNPAPGGTARHLAT